ncbi:MAG: hypothetical protein HON47_02790 [Candidatus Diapherotrites archaeon]|jgi:hypothetical protein|uniref:Uncharacterized protein n=1 Tax=Candidatus Iainarchaeum sp. TaxID=3101447 RepID=A0A8T5GEC9_9ARCH|nr:hypothetical protein [Candidatus Diapherotrites archaeon]MBT7241574.1 hypothetical protein [Candidatus Diapherotrites archaeon]
MEELSELKLEYDRLKRQKDNLEKNYERRKKLKLCDEEYEHDINIDIKQLTHDLGILHRKIKAIESEQHRHKLINE